MRLNVLLIDDDASISKVVAILLEGTHNVVHVESGKDALALFDQGHRFDAILCDMHLDDMTARQVYDALLARSRDQAARVIFISGLELPTATVGLFRGRFLAKPFTKSGLLTKLAKVSTAAASATTQRFRPSGDEQNGACSVR